MKIRVPPLPRPALRHASLLLLAGALAGCTTPRGAAAPHASAPASPLVVRTSGGTLQAGGNGEGIMTGRLDTPPPPRPAPRYDTPRRLASAPAASREAGAEGRATAGEPSSQDRVMLNFVEAELPDVLRALSRFIGRNFVVDPRIKGELTLVSESPVDAGTAYNMLVAALRMRGYTVVDVDGVTRIVPEADGKLQGTPVTVGLDAGAGPSAAGGELVTRVFPLRYESAVKLVPVLRSMIASNNTIAAYPGNNTLVITDYADNLERLAQVIASIDTPASVSTDVVTIHYGVALDVAALASDLLKTRGEADAAQEIIFLADPRSNSVLIRAASPARLSLARDLLHRIDSPETQSGNLHVVYLRNAQATRLAEVLRGTLTGQSGGAQGGESARAQSGRDGLAQNTARAGLAGLAGGAGLAGSAGLGGSAGLAGGAGLVGGAGELDAQRPVAFSAGGATIQADPTTNTLIISAPPPLYRNLRDVIDKLDQRRAQVLVESLIVEVTADNAAEFGIQWTAGGSHFNDPSGSAFVGGANFGGSGISTSRGATTIDALASGLSLGLVRGSVRILGNQVLNLGVLARALQSQGGANILSTPNLMTLDNEEASIMIGRTVPFTTGRYITPGDGAAASPFQTIERQDVGLTLRIRPQISEGGAVKLGIYQEVSSVDLAASLSPDALVTRKRALQTNVLVDNGQIIVLGGLIEDTVHDSAQSVPVLGDIPLLGNLFRYDGRKRSKTNLMVFLRPHIVRDARDSASLTLDRYDYMRTAQTGLPLDGRWIAPETVRTRLPALDRHPDTGLLDLRSSPQPVAGDPVAGNPVAGNPAAAGAAAAGLPAGAAAAP